MNFPILNFLESLIRTVLQTPPKSAPYWFLLKPPCSSVNNVKIVLVTLLFQNMRKNTIYQPEQPLPFKGGSNYILWSPIDPTKLCVHLSHQIWLLMFPNSYRYLFPWTLGWLPTASIYPLLLSWGLKNTERPDFLYTVICNEFLLVLIL